MRVYRVGLMPSLMSLTDLGALVGREVFRLLMALSTCLTCFMKRDWLRKQGR